MRRLQRGAVVQAVVPAVALLLLAPFAWHAFGLVRQAGVGAPACPAEVLLVMGATQYDGQPSPVFRGRLDRALELYKEGCAPRIVVTGGKRQGDRFSEGETGARYLRERGVPGGALVSETRSKNSAENLRFSRGLLGGANEGRLLIVTDDMHAYRSRWLASRLGFNASVAPVKTQGPKLAYALRELVIVTAYSFGLLR